MSAAVEPCYYQLGVSDHSLDRWAERSPQPELDPRTAWKDAISVDYPSIKPPAVHARYHEELDLLLLVAADHTLTTVLPLSYRPRDEQQYIRAQVNHE